jgi:AcrR family transcriptional regulator
MPDPVKARRSYESPRRREQAAATRAAILDAAQRLFELRGYAGASMPAIAAEASVALKTVYVTFETKSGLLHALWNVRLAGDDEPVPVMRRDWYRELLDEPDPRKQLRAIARQSREVKVRAGTVMEIVRNASFAEPSLADLWGRIQSEFYDVLRPIAEHLHRRGATDLTIAKATDVLWTLNHPNVWQLLAVERGWTPEQYEDWLAETLCHQLLTEQKMAVPGKSRPRSGDH